MLQKVCLKHTARLLRKEALTIPVRVLWDLKCGDI